MSWFRSKDSELDWYKTQLSLLRENTADGWARAMRYSAAVQAQIKGIERLNRKVHRLRALLKQHNINPDNGPATLRLELRQIANDKRKGDEVTS